jgi:outer membrane protein OmpA-like peptidoglycan-associated protein
MSPHTMNMRTMSLKTLTCALLLVSLPALAAERPEVIALNQRLVALQSDPQLVEFAAYEKLQAQQAVAVLAKARGKQRDGALYLADRRVEIAETAARAEAARREADRLDRTRSELLVEASRRDAARARQESERLRVQAQIQAEEAERLRVAAEAETLARQDAEDMLGSIAGQQTAKLSAARQKEARLARQEAELMSGAKLPASKFEDRGEVFTLASSAFNAGQANLSSAGSASVSALAAYLQANPKAKARIEGFGDKQTPGQRRADAVRDALMAAGIPKARIQASGKGEGSKSRAVDVVVAQ